MSGRRRSSLLVLAGLTALAFNLRPTAVSIGPVLDEVRGGLPMSAATAGVLTTLPVLCFAAVGALSPALGRRVGLHAAVLGALVVTAAALAARAVVGDSALFLLATVPALGGMAVGNVLLPSLVKHHFPHRIGLVTSLYTTALSVGITAASVATVPAAHLTGSWRGGLAVWAATALVAAMPWIGLVRGDVRPRDMARRPAIPVSATARTRLAWAMALFFGTQSMQAYAVFGWLPQVFRDAGFSASTAGLLLGVCTATGIPVSFLLPSLAVRIRSQAPLVLLLCGCYVVGYAGLIIWPAAGALAWALLIGIGTGMFPLVLTLIGLRARTADGTAALSGFTQSVGYLVAAVGPFLTGALYGATGGWTVPLTALILLVVPQAVCGALVSAPRYLEDELPSASP